MRISRATVAWVIVVTFVAIGLTSIGDAAAKPKRYAVVVSRTRIPFEPLTINEGFGSVWVSTDLGVSRIDPATGEIVAQVGVGGVASVAMGHAGVFISSYANNRVARIDPSTNSIVWSKHVVGALRLALGGGSLWAWSPVAGALTRISTANGHVAPAITIDRHLPAAIGLGGEPDDHGFATGLAVGAGSVWVGSRVSEKLVRIDPATDRVIARIRTHGLNPYGIAVGGGAVWVTDYGDPADVFADATFLSRVDTRTQRVRSYPLNAYGDQVAVADGSIWISAANGILRFDPRTGRVADTLRVTQLPPFPSFGLWAIASGSDRLWAATLTFEAGVDDVLYQIDPNRTLSRPHLPPIIEPAPGLLPVDIAQQVPMTSGHVCTEVGRLCRQSTDVYVPTGPGPHPVIVLAHEFCGPAGCKRYLAMLADVLSVDGAVVFNADFADPQPPYLPRRQLKSQDLACAVRFARARAASYGGDPSRVTLVSHLSASWTAATVALDGDAHVGDSCLVKHGSALPDAFVGIADAPNRSHTPDLGGNPDLEVRMIIGRRDAKVTPAAFRRVGAFADALAAAGYDATATIVHHGAFANSEATHSNIDIGSRYPTIWTILEVAA